jgi:hypothetical protein
MSVRYDNMLTCMVDHWDRVGESPYDSEHVGRGKTLLLPLLLASSTDESRTDYDTAVLTSGDASTSV